MTDIRVHLLNFHSPFNSHIEIVLEDLSRKRLTQGRFYRINRWTAPNDRWSEPPKYLIKQASSVYHFDIVADPNEIVEEWKKYWDDTWDKASIFTENCAVATQRILREVADVPEPDSSNWSLNYLGFGIWWPSFIPCFVTLPGRVMANAKDHLEKKNNPETSAQHSRLLDYTYRALAILAFIGSLTFAVTVVLPLALAALTIAIGLLVIALPAAAIVGSTVIGLSNVNRFFKEKSMSDDIQGDRINHKAFMGVAAGT